MVVSLFGLAATLVAATATTGVAIGLALVVPVGFVTDPSTLGAGAIAALTLVACSITALVLWGERDAAEHAVAATGATQITEADRPELFGIVRSVAQRADTPVPSVYVASTDSPLSLVTGFTPERARLILSDGLLETLETDELEAVVAHELAHVANRDVAVMTAVALPVGAAGRVLELLSGPTAGVDYGRPSRADVPDALLTVGLFLVFPITILAYALSASFSRTREFAADRGAVAITGKPAALASALESIDTTLADRPATDLRRSEIAAFAIVEPSSESGPTGIFAPLWRVRDRVYATHPDPETRIERLRERVIDTAGRPS